MYETPISRLFVDHPLSSECLCVLLFFVRCFFGRTQNCHGNSSAEILRLRVTPPPNAIAAQALFKGRLVFANHPPNETKLKALGFLEKNPGRFPWVDLQLEGQTFNQVLELARLQHAPTQSEGGEIFRFLGLKFQVLFFVVHVEGGFKDVTVDFFRANKKLLIHLCPIWWLQTLKPPTIPIEFIDVWIQRPRGFFGTQESLRKTSHKAAVWHARHFPSSVVGLYPSLKCCWPASGR